MALDTKLKSEMGNHFAAEPERQREEVPPVSPGFPVEPAKPVEPEKPAEPKKTAESAKPEEPKQPVNAEIPPNIGMPRWKESQETVPKEKPIRQTAEKDAEMENLLKSIEKQLKTLNQNVADLGLEVENCKNPDYQTIFTKIDAARSSIVRVISGINDTKSEDSEETMRKKLTELEELIREIGQKQDRNDRQITQTLRENANFQIQVRQGMQKELDEFRGKQNGEQFNPILKLIAGIYVDYQGLLEDETIVGRSKKNVKALFDDLEDLLNDYDAEIIRSEVGSLRRTRGNKIIEKILTGDEAKHNTIAVSRRPGVMRDRIVLSPEFIDVFVYDPSMAEAEPVKEQPLDNQGEEAESQESLESVGEETDQQDTKEETDFTEERAEIEEETMDNQKEEYK